MSKVAEYWEPFFDLIDSEPRRRIMFALHAVHVLYEEAGVLFYGDKLIKLDEEGKRKYEQMTKYGGGLNFSKLEGHYKFIELKEKPEDTVEV
jgi:hypothetical protein